MLSMKITRLLHYERYFGVYKNNVPRIFKWRNLQAYFLYTLISFIKKVNKKHLKSKISLNKMERHCFRVIKHF